jgi:hypothetical protein
VIYIYIYIYIYKEKEKEKEKRKKKEKKKEEGKRIVKRKGIIITSIKKYIKTAEKYALTV